ncbi:MAG: sugar transferase [Candidatus Paceibacterota bacterium]|jgi:exopolysaccharide biosynthesis polyprenyl glycosylphosphotransferase
MQIDRIKLITIDSISLTLTFLLSLFLRQSSLLNPYFGKITFDKGGYLLSFIIASVLLIIIFSAFRLYRVRNIELSARIFTVLKALVVWTLIITAVIYAIKYDFSRGVLFLTVLFTVIFITLTRFGYFRYRRNGKKDGDDNVHIIGTGDRAKDIEKQIKNVFPNLSVIKLDFNDPQTATYLRTINSDDIFIADEYLGRERVMKILADQNLKHHSFRVILDTFRLVTGEIRLNNIDDIPSITPNVRPNTVYLYTKRIIDIVIAGTGMIIVTPLWLIITAVIKLDSNGPALIQQSRIGSDGRPFTLWKFRTMHCTATLYEYAPQNETDPRITKIGRFLRRLSLDELPQLWNIFKGDMSLVGPRPEMEFIVKKYEPWQQIRLKAKPGLTGLWQILGRKDIPLHENLEYDFYYVCNQSMLLDSVIILKTIPAVLFGRGAY